MGSFLASSQSIKLIILKLERVNSFRLVPHEETRMVVNHAKVGTHWQRNAYDI